MTAWVNPLAEVLEDDDPAPFDGWAVLLRALEERARAGRQTRHLRRPGRPQPQAPADYLVLWSLVGVSATIRDMGEEPEVESAPADDVAEQLEVLIEEIEEHLHIADSDNQEE